MTRTLIKSRLQSNKHKPKNKQEVKNSKSKLPSSIQTFKQKQSSGNGFVEYKWNIELVCWFFYFIFELRRFSIFR